MATPSPNKKQKPNTAEHCCTACKKALDLATDAVLQCEFCRRYQYCDDEACLKNIVVLEPDLSILRIDAHFICLTCKRNPTSNKIFNSPKYIWKS